MAIIKGRYTKLATTLGTTDVTNLQSDMIRRAWAVYLTV